MILLSEAAPDLDADSSDADVVGATVAAARAGLRVFHLPRGTEPDPDALAGVPVQEQPERALWVGYIPTPARYADVWAQARERRIELVNDPEAHLTALEFDRAYARLTGLTPKSAVLRDPSECPRALSEIGLPAFVKGLVLSRKWYGWKSCVATTPEELQAIVGRLFALKAFSRQRVVVRQLVPLRTRGLVEGTDFPKGREYRIFLFGGEVAGHGYYWPFEDPVGALSPDDERDMLSLAREAAGRLAVPWISIDLGQLEDGRWIVIEAGDPQFAGLGHIDVGALWRRVAELAAPSESRST